MNKGNSLIIGFSILLGFAILGLFVMLTFGGKTSAGVSNASTTERYEMITVNKNNMIIFDKQSGEFWRKFISDSEGPTEWVKESSPISNAK
ncbi:hypothetical protein EHS13_24070 [Paenibacillus psychroresistens]|uniref:Uncharacterized protein n=1 Tax=Paenibacillus psychroresistens TaxID=1778678 RepID=A0A6B8RPX2_9BACL|nr:hypothetical protein [Paenibacillus psychroresistens]QGQ97742.1 hypothetical protein EHS13_24070 [Paenibacillus psychroresistens]